MLTTTLPPLPAGYRPAPPVSGVVTVVTSASNTAVTLHRAEYTHLDPGGGWTSHGYAWRCTGCRHVLTGYPAQGFGRALTDARTHVCEEPR
ncbi:hypothetical protein [Streptomyces sp. Z26]|uniref:hypothetical protein n=1 Tax=Streptomyces sp. Z26 TaxID=2500177 RepID=UPI000EF13B47|nr:hypothetical protein [Streptomyces sp. Z26]RLL68152.1 hypothetical protein D7M15_16355 [Streptomyces sp. Z26]